MVSALLLVASCILLLAGGLARPLAAQMPPGSLCASSVAAEGRSGWVWLPRGQVFCPLVADPKGERSFVSYLRGDFATIAEPEPGARTDIGAVGLSDGVAIVRWAGARPGDGVQLDLAGAVFAQLNLGLPSFDLINQDYLVGLPLTFRRGGFSGRLRVYHQSSHLGDEFLLARQPERVNLSFESFELLLSQEIGPVRAYGGGETFFRKEPDELASRLVHAGAELHQPVFGGLAAVAALDLKAVDQEGWTTSWSASAGMEIARIGGAGHPSRAISLVAEYYNGAAPYGQFYRDNIEYWGLALTLSR